MAAPRYRLLARKGWFIFLGCAVAGLAAWYWLGWPAALPLLAAAGYFLLLYRDPVREIPSTPLAVLSPADGTISYLREAYDPFLDREAIRVSLAPRRMGAYSLRSPVEGKVLELGVRGPEKAHVGGLRLQTDEGDDVVVIVHGGKLRWRSPYRVPIGERVGQGQRCGSTRFIERIDLYLAVNARPRVSLGATVRAGRDAIALLTPG